MKKLCFWGALSLFLFVLSGCGKSEGPGARSETEPLFKNGEQVTRELGEGVTLDAAVEIPENWDGTVDTCRVKNVFFHGRDLAGRLYPEIPKEEWTADYADIGDEEGVLYMGDMWIEPGQEPEQGIINLALGISIGTDEIRERKRFFPQYTRSEYVPDETAMEEFSFASREETEERVKRYWTETVGLEGVRPLEIYSVPHESLQKVWEEFYAEGGEEKPDDWDETDDSYDVRMEQVVNGLPLTAHYSGNVRKDDVYVPTGEVTAIVTCNGLEEVVCVGNYEILEKKTEEAVSMEKIYETLEKKFQMMLYGTTTVDKMRLVYFPFPLSTDINCKEYEFVPVWCFSFRTGGTGITRNIYINAVTGEEVME